jgi:hypothetical protein
MHQIEFPESDLEIIRYERFHHPEEFRRQPPRSVAEAAQRIEQFTGILRKPTQVRAFLRNTLGLHWRKVAAVPLPPKKTLEQHIQTQDNFLK